MVLIDRWSAMARCLSLAALALAAVAADAAAETAAIPQAQSGGRVVRERQCADCGEADKARRVREALLVRLDSLRWEIDHRRLTEIERRHAATELAKTLDALEASLVSSASEANALMAIEAQAAARSGATQRAVAVVVESGRARGARGYIGVTFDGLWARPPGSIEDNVIRFYDYPRIALVDDSSPAERAGVLVGDTVVALNGDDVKEHEIAFGKLLDALGKGRSPLADRILTTSPDVTGTTSLGPWVNRRGTAATARGSDRSPATRSPRKAQPRLTSFWPHCRPMFSTAS